MLLKRSRRLSAITYRGLGSSTRKLLPIIAIFGLIFFFYQLFIVKRVECHLNSEICPPEIISKLNKNIGSNILLVNQKDIKQAIGLLFPVEKIDVGFRLFNTLTLNIAGQISPLSVQTSLVEKLPSLSIDTLIVSSESAIFNKPTEEINTFNQAISFTSFEIWSNGLMSPAATSESKIRYLFTEKPSLESIRSLYSMVKLVEKYLNVDQIMILNQRVFLRQANQPDIIVNIPFDEGNLVQALQSHEYLTTIKKDTKVIDLRFKNPILR